MVFTTSLRMIFRWPGYLFVYIVLFGALGLVVTGTMGGGKPDTVGFTQATPSVAIIDRDHSELSNGLADFLEQQGTRVEIADEVRALQDATAQNAAAFIAIIPAGYEEEFVASARAGVAPPELETIVSVEVAAGMLMEAETANFLNAVRWSVMASEDASIAEVVSDATEAANLEAPYEVVQSAQEVSSGSLVPYFFQWSAYAITMGVSVLVAVTFSAFQATEVRRRNLASPMSPTSMNLRIGASGLMIVAMAWVFICVLSLAPQVGGLEVAQSSPGSMAMLALAALVYSLVPFSVGFLCSQLRMGEMAVNGFVNTLALAMMFLSGIFTGGTSFLSEPMQALTRIVPTYWYAEAINCVAEANELTGATLAHYLTDLGVVALFALALFAIALIIGRLRARSGDAGGNPV